MSWSSSSSDSEPESERRFGGMQRLQLYISGNKSKSLLEDAKQEGAVDFPNRLRVGTRVTVGRRGLQRFGRIVAPDRRYVSEAQQQRGYVLVRTAGGSKRLLRTRSILSVILDDDSSRSASPSASHFNPHRHARRSGGANQPGCHYPGERGNCGQGYTCQGAYGNLECKRKRRKGGQTQRSRRTAAAEEDIPEEEDVKGKSQSSRAPPTATVEKEQEVIPAGKRERLEYYINEMIGPKVFRFTQKGQGVELQRLADYLYLVEKWIYIDRLGQSPLVENDKDFSDTIAQLKDLLTHAPPSAKTSYLQKLTATISKMGDLLAKYD